MRTYANRELSEKLDINFQRWKRLSREFLPPDDIASLPKGKARKYTPDEAFKVYLGAHLIELGFLIIEARRIIEDLSPWLAEKGQWIENKLSVVEGIDQHVQKYTISIVPMKIWPKPPKDDKSKSLGIEEWLKSNKPRFGFNYKVRGYITCERDEYKGYSVMSEKFITYTLDTTLPRAIDGKEVPFNEHHPQKPGTESTDLEIKTYLKAIDAAKELSEIDHTKPVKMLNIGSLRLYFGFAIGEWNDLPLL